MGIRYGNTIIKKDPCFFVSLCHCVILGLGQAVRVSVEQSVPVMAVRPVFISLSLDNVISPSYGGTAGDHRIPLHGHMAAHGNGHIRRVSVCPDAPVSIIIVCIARLFRPATLSQYRIREQYLVINYPASLHRCLRYHELYTFPVHLCLPHKPLHDKPC